MVASRGRCWGRSHRWTSAKCRGPRPRWRPAGRRGEQHRPALPTSRCSTRPRTTARPGATLPTPVTLTGLYGVGTTLYAYAASAPDADGPALSSAPLYRSTDAGATWTLVSPPFANVSDLAFVRSTDGATTYGVGLIPADTAYGSEGHQVIVSKDGGATWSRIDAPPTLGTLDTVMLPNGTLLLQSQLQERSQREGSPPRSFAWRRRVGMETDWDRAVREWVAVRQSLGRSGRDRSGCGRPRRVRLIRRNPSNPAAVWSGPICPDPVSRATKRPSHLVACIDTAGMGRLYLMSRTWQACHHATQPNIWCP